MPYFSVIIPVYNKERFIKNTLQSVLSQSFTDFEVIIVNDGSTDNSRKVIDEFSDDRIRIFEQKNSGASAARNFGITQVKSNYITFLDADDYWYPDCLMHFKSMIERFAGEPVFASAVDVENEKNILPAQYSIAKSQTPQLVNFFEASLRESAICTSCAVFHKSVFERIGYFDTALKNGEDTDLWIRIGLEFNLVFSHEIMARYVYDARSLSRGNQHLAHKLNLKKFSEPEKTNLKLKKFLDLNRFSLAIKSKIYGQKEMFQEYVREINPQNLSFKKKLLLKLPGSVLLFLVKVNVALAAVGLSKSVFK